MKRIFSAALLILAVSQTLYARIPCGEKRRLASGWEYVRGDLSGPWEAVRPREGDKPENFPIWTRVELPHCFNARDAVDPDVNYYQGPGWYRTALDVANPFANGRTVLEFEGAGQMTEVFVYTRRVGAHWGGYDSWSVDITEAVRDFLRKPEAARFGGKIPLVVRCDNRRDADMVPSNLSDFNVYGGLYRHVHLVYLPELSISALRIEPVVDKGLKKGHVKVYASFLNPSGLPHTDARLRIKDPSGKEVVSRNLPGITPSGEVLLAEADLARVRLWDVDDPQLYTCEVSLSADGREQAPASDRFGFRQFEFVEKGPFTLNGRRLLLRGTHRHEDHAGLGAALTDDLVRREMQMIKDMGANFIRLGHYQQSDLTLDLCDSLGIVVWEEIPWCRGGVGYDRYRDITKNMLRVMIAQHRNHPSIVLWGLGNENDWPGDFETFDKEQIRSFMTELNDLAHASDSSRVTSIRRCDFARDIPDVYSPSIWAGWYSKGPYTGYKQTTLKEIDRVKHYLHVEWGGDSHAGRHSETPDSLPEGTGNMSVRGLWDESYIVRLFDWHLKEQETMPTLTGTAQWVFKDFSTPIRPDNPVPYMNQKGVVTRDLTPKESYYVFQSYWAKKPMLHIYGHTWPVRWGAPGEAKEILVYSNCPEVELLVNGRSYGKKKRDSQDFPAAGLRWNVPLNEGPNTIEALAAGGLRDRVEVEYQSGTWGAPAALRHTLLPLPGGGTRLEVQIVDAAGKKCLDSRAWIDFGVAGEGRLLDNLGTPGGSRRVQAANGRASIEMQPTGPGGAVISASVEGIKSLFVTVNP